MLAHGAMCCSCLNPACFSLNTVSVTCAGCPELAKRIGNSLIGGYRAQKLSPRDVAEGIYRLAPLSGPCHAFHAVYTSFLFVHLL